MGAATKTKHEAQNDTFNLPYLYLACLSLMSDCNPHIADTLRGRDTLYRIWSCCLDVCSWEKQSGMRPEQPCCNEDGSASQKC